MTYHDIVARTQHTSISSPMMVEGLMVDGRHFFFHYNFGYATLGIGGDRMTALREGMLRGMVVESDLPSWLNDDQYREVFLSLYQLYETAESDTVQE